MSGGQRMVGGGGGVGGSGGGGNDGDGKGGDVSKGEGAGEGGSEGGGADEGSVSRRRLLGVVGGGADPTTTKFSAQNVKPDQFLGAVLGGMATGESRDSNIYTLVEIENFQSIQSIYRQV